MKTNIIARTGVAQSEKEIRLDATSPPSTTHIELRRKLDERPFEPFVLELTDGRSIEVRYPEMNLVKESYILVGIPAPDDPNPVFYDLTEIVHYSQIMSIRSLAQSSPVS